MQLVIGLNYPSIYYKNYGFTKSGYTLPIYQNQTILEKCIKSFKNIDKYYFILYEKDELSDFIDISKLTISYTVIKTPYNNKGFFDYTKLNKLEPFIYVDGFIICDINLNDLIKEDDEIVFISTKSFSTLKPLPIVYYKNSEIYEKFINDELLKSSDIFVETQDILWLHKPIHLFEHLSQQIKYELLIDELQIKINDNANVLLKYINKMNGFHLSNTNICIILDGECHTIEEDSFTLSSDYIIIGEGTFIASENSSYCIINDTSIKDKKDCCAILEKKQLLKSNIIGQEKPGIYYTSNYVIKIINYNYNDTEFYYTNCLQKMYISKGKLQINNMIYDKKSLIEINPYTITCITCLEECEIIVCNIPTKDVCLYEKILI